ncbi:MAG: hypothetical protein IJW32_05575 [Clostridia bacterium]|nr:hypothetical protein [Clostridia bacterium]
MINTIIIVLVIVFVVSLFLLCLPKIIKFVKTQKSKSKKSKKKKGKKKGDDKLKASKAVQEIRPIVKPANKEKAAKETKEIEAKKQGKSLPAPEKKQSLDFKYSATKKSSIEDEDEFNPRNFAPKQQPTQKVSQQPYSIQTGKGNPLNRDIKKEFEDIRAFLDLPENKGQQNLNDKYEAARQSISRQSQNVPVKRVDASTFSETPTYFSKNRDEDEDEFVVPSSYRANTKYAKPTPYPPIGAKTTTPKPLNYKIDKTPINVSELKKGAGKNTKEDEYLKFDDENVDLNKLSPKLKRFIIENILNRKNFD